MIDSRLFEAMFGGACAFSATPDAMASLNKLARRIVEREALAENAAPSQNAGGQQATASEENVARQLEALRLGAARSRHLD